MKVVSVKRNRVPNKRHDILASTGVFSTGISIKRLDNIFFTSSFKAEIKILQSIGRLLRKGNGSDNAVLYDITDDLSTPSKSNYTLAHFKKRLDIYIKEKFKISVKKIRLS